MKKIDTIFIVDDDYSYQFLAEIIIEETKLVKNIKIFSHGLEAIEFFKSSMDNIEELPDVVLLDLNMPVMDGWQFLEEYIQLKPRLGKKITIYIVSSSIYPADMERAKSISEVSDFIIKPVTEEIFVEIVNNL